MGQGHGAGTRGRNTGQEHGAWTQGTDMDNGAWTQGMDTGMDTGHGHRAWTQGMDTGYGHGQGHRAWTWTSEVQQKYGRLITTRTLNRMVVLAAIPRKIYY